MRIYLVIVSLGLALAGASCGGNAQPSGQANTAMRGTTDPSVGGAATVLPSNSSARPRNEARVEGDVPPPDARFTIFCDVYRGPDHVVRASRLKNELTAKSNLHAWHIVHTEQQSMLCFGYYRTYTDHDHDPREAARAQADLKLISAMKDAQGDRLFKMSLFGAVDEKDPESPADWNLVNAPVNAYWTLQIAAFRGSNDRKERAVKAVREARSSGVEAYYYHGETISSVCVGTWPREAVKEQDSAVAQTADPTATLLVVPRPLPANVSSDIRDREGNRLTVQAPKLEITDPGMAAAIRIYPNHAINGEDHAIRTKEGQLIFDSSFLVAIPHSDVIPDPIARPNANAVSGADRAASDIFDNPTPVQQPGRGKLRSLGD